MISFKNDAYTKDLKDKLSDGFYNVLKDTDVILAGGSVLSILTNTTINDFDFYFKSKESLKKCAIDANVYVLGYTDKSLYFRCNNRYPAQFIYFDFFKSVDDIFENFDFSCCMCAYSFANECFYLTESCMQSCLNKEIEFNIKTKFPMTTLTRIPKYLEKGFKFKHKDLLKLSLCISSLNIDSPEKFKAAIGGVYGQSFDDKHLNEIWAKDIPLFDKYIESLDAINVEISVDNSIFETGLPIDTILQIILKDKITLIKYNDTYLIQGNSESYEEEELCDLGIDINLCEIINYEDLITYPLTVYKKVIKRNNNTYLSSYDKSYEYKIGQIHKPKDLSKYGSGLYVYLEPQSCNQFYINLSEDTAILKCEITSKEDLLNSELDLIKGKAVRCSAIKVIEEFNTKKVTEEVNNECVFF